MVCNLHFSYFPDRVIGLNLSRRFLFDVRNFLKGEAGEIKFSIFRIFHFVKWELLCIIQSRDLLDPVATFISASFERLPLVVIIEIRKHKNSLSIFYHNLIISSLSLALTSSTLLLKTCRDQLLI